MSSVSAFAVTDNAVTDAQSRESGDEPSFVLFGEIGWLEPAGVLFLHIGEVLDLT